MRVATPCQLDIELPFVYALSQWASAFCAHTPVSLLQERRDMWCMHDTEIWHLCTAQKQVQWYPAFSASERKLPHKEPCPCKTALPQNHTKLSKSYLVRVQSAFFCESAIFFFISPTVRHKRPMQVPMRELVGVHGRCKVCFNRSTSYRGPTKRPHVVHLIRKFILTAVYCATFHIFTRITSQLTAESAANSSFSQLQNFFSDMAYVSDL